MPEFLRLLPPAEALHLWMRHLPANPPLGVERIPARQALGRILAESITASADLPSFTRSTVDGFAVRAADTFGATASLPAYLRLVGEVHMGSPADLSLGPGQAALVHTGGMIPEGSDAVVMVEDTQTPRQGEVEILRPAAVGHNVIRIGEDVRAGDVVLEPGHRLRPQEIGGLMAFGITEVGVARRPRVAILSTGDEVVAPEATPGPGQIRDVNTAALATLIEEAGGLPRPKGILPDRYDDLLEAAQAARRSEDVVVITAGSSVSTRDLTARVIQALGTPGVIVHGVAIRPGKPTILAAAGDLPIVGLPGNPVSALVIAHLFLRPALRHLLGQPPALGQPVIRAKLSLNVPSEAGREDHVAVRLTESDGGLMAEPVFGRSNLIFTLVRAAGLVRIPAGATGLPAGAEVDVHPF
jgi:molybdopterin molybdotransferase